MLLQYSDRIVGNGGILAAIEWFGFDFLAAPSMEFAINLDYS